MRTPPEHPHHQAPPRPRAVTGKGLSSLQEADADRGDRVLRGETSPGGGVSRHPRGSPGSDSSHCRGRCAPNRWAKCPCAFKELCPSGPVPTLVLKGVFKLLWRPHLLLVPVWLLGSLAVHSQAGAVDSPSHTRGGAAGHADVCTP